MLYCPVNSTAVQYMAIGCGRENPGFSLAIDI